MISEPQREAAAPHLGAHRGEAQVIGFDLDGTLIDTRKRQVAVAEAVVTRMGGMPLDRRRFWSHKRSGLNTEQALARLRYPQELAHRAAELWVGEIELDGNLDLDFTFVGAITVLENMRASGYRTLLVTARSSEVGLSRELQRLGLSDLLDQVVRVAPGRSGGPKQAVLRATGAVAFIGDTEVDHAAAQGIRFAAVSTGQRSAGFLRRQAVTPIFSNLNLAVRKVLM